VTVDSKLCSWEPAWGSATQGAGLKRDWRTPAAAGQGHVGGCSRKPARMSYMLPHLDSGYAVDQAILSEEDRVVIIRFGHDWDPVRRPARVWARGASRACGAPPPAVFFLPPVPGAGALRRLRGLGAYFDQSARSLRPVPVHPPSSAARRADARGGVCAGMHEDGRDLVPCRRQD